MIKIIINIALIVSSTVILTTNALSLELKGDTSCTWGSKDCNRCVNDVKANFNAIDTKLPGTHSSKIRVRSYAYPAKNYMLNRINSGYEHLQGIGRIAGLGNNEYFVFTHSTNADKARVNGALAVVRMGANQESKGFELGDLSNLSESAGSSNQNIHNRTVARTYSGSNHPGGLTTLGHYVFVADWCQNHGKHGWCNNATQYAFEVYDVSKAHLNTHLNSNPPVKIIDRSIYNDPWLNKASTASIAATRLESGYYLVAIGKRGGRHYGFYLSSTPELSRNTHWDLIDDEAISNRGENATMVNECGTGDIYHIQIEEHGGRLFKSDQLHLYKLNGSLNKDQISYQHIKSRSFDCYEETQPGESGTGLAWCNFDNGGSLYISPTGNLYLYATHAQQAKGSETFRMVEFGNHKETGFDINWLIPLL